MKCKFYIKDKNRFCKNRVSDNACMICSYHYQFLKKKKLIGLYKIAYLIKKNKYNFFQYIYYKHILKKFFSTYCFVKNSSQCSICLEYVIDKKNEIKLNCGHCFHKYCIVKYLTVNKQKKRCPNCRQDVFFKNANYLRIKKYFVVRVPQIIYQLYFHNHYSLKIIYREEFFEYVLNNFFHEVILFLR